MPPGFPQITNGYTIYQPVRTAGAVQAAARLAVAPKPDTGQDPGDGVTLELNVSLRAVADALAADQAWRDRIANGIGWIDVPAIGAFTPAQAPYLQGTWGPNDGYHWAVQRITVATLATGDTLEVYRGASTADVQPQNLRNSWLAANGPAQVWNPGRTGLILPPGQNLVFTGTLTGGPYTINADVIQLESWLLPYFLL